MDRLSYTLTNEDEELYLKELLQRRLKFSSRLIKKIKFSGHLYLNGRPAAIKQKGRAGDVMEVEYPEESSYFEPENIPLDIVYEDADLMIVNKPAGLIVHPTKNYQNGTLANALAWLIKERGESWKIRFVNRLDRDTSGLVIIAKNPHAQDFISDLMSENRVVKKYKALVHGIIREDGSVDAPIAKDPDHVARRKVIEGGYPSLTDYRVLETFPGPFGEDPEGFTLAELTLHTGRTHQIRVHMSHIGHPIAGDELYGQLFACPYPELGLGRQALHSFYLEFEQPVTGETVKAEVSLPEDIEAALELLRSRNEAGNNRA